MKNRKKTGKPEPKIPVRESGHLPAIEPAKPETQKNGPIILTGLKLEAEDGSGRSLELARCLDQYGYAPFFVDHGTSRRPPRTVYCPHCKRRHNALTFVDAVDEGWDVLSEDNDCCISPETLISGVIRLLRKPTAVPMAATS